MAAGVVPAELVVIDVPVAVAGNDYPDIIDVSVFAAFVESVQVKSYPETGGKVAGGDGIGKGLAGLSSWKASHWLLPLALQVLPPLLEKANLRISLDSRSPPSVWSQEMVTVLPA